MADESIPGFTVEPELEDLLDEHPLDLDEDTRERVQLYKSRKLQAKRDAGLSGEAPSWTVRYPGERAGRASGNGEAPPAPEPSVEKKSPEDAAGSGTPPGRTEKIEAPEEGDEALMEYYRSVKSGSGRPRRTGGGSTREDDAPDGTGSSSNVPPPDVAPPAPAQADTAQVLALVKEWVNSLETRLEQYHEKIVALEEENAELRQELGRRRD